MEYQNYTYARLDSLNSEVNKKSDNVSDIKISVEDEQALLERTVTVIKKEKINKIKYNKRVLSTLDKFMTIFIVTPCVVGCWRGLWQIMDFYAFYFPPWESFAIGVMSHIILALGQDVFHYVIVEKQGKNPILKLFSLFVMKFYIVTFHIITVLTWRGVWILFDHYCQLKISSSAFALVEGSSTEVRFTLVCILTLMCLKLFRNTLAPPVSIALDLKDEIFLFSTRYIYKIIYISISATQAEHGPTGNVTEAAEKLVASQSMQVEQIQKQPPRPFGIKILGPPPHEFTATSPSPTSSAIQTTPMNYPQLTNYRNNYYPKNIQDLIGYMSNNRSYNVDKKFYTAKKKPQATTQEGIVQAFNASDEFTRHDPFYPYKPADPSEINLLATASFRFAPPVWKNFQKLYQHPTQQPTQLYKHTVPPSLQQVEDSDVQETIKNFGKPFVVTLNIFPMDNDPSRYSRYERKVLSQRIHGGYPYRLQGDPRPKIGSIDNKMTIHLNVFPESFFTSLGQSKERYAESSVNKIKFV